MSKFKTYKGIIFRINDSGATDKVITVLTNTGDRIAFLAKGVKSAKSRKSSSIEFGNYVVIKALSGYALPLITDISIKDEYSKWKKEVDSMMILQALCELTEKSTIDGENDPSVFSLYTFLVEYGQEDPVYSLCIYIIKILSIQGILPDLSHCISTGKDIDSSKATHSLHLVGFLLPNDKIETSKIDPTIYKIIRYIESAQIQSVFSLKPDLADSKKVLKLLLHWFELAFEVNLKSKKVLYSIVKL